MTDNMIVEWDDRYLIGIPLIDDQHKELIRLTNALYESCLQGDEAARESFKIAIQGTVDYVKFHFSAEERVLQNVNYPEFAVHKKQHEEFVKQILEEVKAFEEGKKFVPNVFVRFLRDWILTHIAMADKKYAAYIIHLKKNGALKTKEDFSKLKPSVVSLMF
ncbi:MAG: bacteriohemerythrin [Spirochaetaceae bacterium]|jgi:hemerythrin|nr:bacteriohemerythrin [Spirochaetaceae bacterium]